MQKHLKLLLTLGSAALLIGAWGFQYLGYAPCKMCYWQRYPHMAAVVLGVILLATKQRVFAWFAAVATAITGGIGVYHSGVERGFWEGPTTCTSGDISSVNADDLFNQIMSAPLVRCDEIAWQVLGVSMANLNALFSFGLMIGWIYVARKD